jgi:hypothetical protein
MCRSIPGHQKEETEKKEEKGKPLSPKRKKRRQHTHIVPRIQ